MIGREMRDAGTAGVQNELISTIDRSLLAGSMLRRALGLQLGTAIKQERYRASKKSPSAIDLHRELNAFKKTDVPWMYQVSKCAPQEALWNLDAAFTITSSAAVPSRSKGSGRAGSGIPSSRPRRRGWAVSGSPAVLWCRTKAILLPLLGRLQLKERDICPPMMRCRSSRPP